jgi:hypothetical protein
MLVVAIKQISNHQELAVQHFSISFYIQFPIRNYQ